MPSVPSAAFRALEPVVQGLARPQHGFIFAVQSHRRFVIGQVERGLANHIGRIAESRRAAMAWLKRMYRPRASLK